MPTLSESETKNFARSAICRILILYFLDKLNTESLSLYLLGSILYYNYSLTINFQRVFRVLRQFTGFSENYAVILLEILCFVP